MVIRYIANIALRCTQLSCCVKKPDRPPQPTPSSDVIHVENSVYSYIRWTYTNLFKTL